MAEETVSLKLVIEAANSAQTMGEVKKALTDINKELQNVKVGSKEFQDLTIAAGKLKGEMMDTKNQIKALDPDQRIKAIGGTVSMMANGFSAATSAAALFGTKNEELLETLTKVQAAASFANAIGSLQGFTDQFRILGAVLKTNPILMTATVLTGVGVALFALKDKIQVVGDAFNWMGEKLKDIGEWFGLYSREAEALLLANEKIAESLDNLNGKWQHQINLLKAAGKDTYVAEQTRLGILKKGTEDQIKNLEEARRLGKSIDEKKYQELKDALVKYQQESEVLRVQHNTDLANKINASNTEDYNRYKAALDKKRDAIRDHLKEIETLEFKKFETDFEKQTEEIDKKFAQKQWEIEYEKKIDDEATANKIKRKQDERAALEIIAQNSVSSMISLGELFINNSKKLEKFQKATALVQIAIDTAKAISYLTRDSMGNPYNVLTGGVTGIAQFSTGIAMILANMAKAKQILNSGGSASPSMPSAPRGGGGEEQLPIPQLNPLQPTSTLINPDGTVNVQGKREAPIKVYVTETDITDTQNKVNSINKKAKIN